MPILSLERDVELYQGLPRLGKLRKGSPKQGNTSGRDLNHFRVDFEEPFEHLLPIWEQMYGKEPKSFQPVYVLGSTPDDAFSRWKEEWNATTMLRRCDSETIQVHYNRETGFYSNDPLPCVAGKCACKPVGRLNLMLPDFMAASGVFGYFTVETHSREDIVTLLGALNVIRHMCGTLEGVPLVFGRQPQSTSAPEIKDGKRTGNRLRVTRAVFFLYLHPDYTKAQMVPAMAAGAPTPRALETGAGRPVTDPERAKALLGAGDNRRIITGDGEIIDGGNQMGTEDDESEFVEWTADDLWEELKDCFSNVVPHFENTLNKYLDEGMISEQDPLMTTLAIIRLVRSTEGKHPLAVFADEESRTKFIGMSIGMVKDDAAVVAALQKVATYKLEQGLMSWRGDKKVAWAALLAASKNYAYKQIEFAANVPEVVREIARLICQRHQQAEAAQQHVTIT